MNRIENNQGSRSRRSHIKGGAFAALLATLPTSETWHVAAETKPSLTRVSIQSPEADMSYVLQLAEPELVKLDRFRAHLTALLPGERNRLPTLAEIPPAIFKDLPPEKQQAFRAAIENLIQDFAQKIKQGDTGTMAQNSGEKGFMLGFSDSVAGVQAGGIFSPNFFDSFVGDFRIPGTIKSKRWHLGLMPSAGFEGRISLLEHNPIYRRILKAATGREEPNPRMKEYATGVLSRMQSEGNAQVREVVRMWLDSATRFPVHEAARLSLPAMTLEERMTLSKTVPGVFTTMSMPEAAQRILPLHLHPLISVMTPDELKKIGQRFIDIRLEQRRILLAQ